MTTTIAWTIDWMQVSTQPIAGEQEVVLTAGWRCTGTNGSYSATNYGTCSFPEPTSGGSFTPYANLTQAQVVGWCWENGVDQTATEASVENQVTALVNPPVTQPPLPWAPSTPPVVEPAVPTTPAA
jgi:hypothetical protein